MSNKDRKYPEDNRHYADLPHKAHITYIVIIGLIFVCFTLVFLCFPRTTFSVTENRKLDEFPALSSHDGPASEYTAKVSQWFSDSEPYRDQFMTLSMAIRDALKYRSGDDAESVSFRPTEGFDDGVADEGITPEELVAAGNPNANDNAKKAASGILIVGSGPNVRALMAFGAVPEYSKPYVDLCNHFAEAFPEQQIFGIVSPNATAFYLPDKAKNASKPQEPVFDYINKNVSPKVKFVRRVYDYLAAHTQDKDDIFLRTDHHWAPLGGYYAAKAFAELANVPFKDISTYQRKVVKGYVGTMYGYSKDIAVKNAPEDFVYFVPDSTVKYNTTYITYNLNKDNKPVSETKPYEGPYFHHFQDGSGGAYCTFMGGDRHIVQVRTNANSKRKLMIIKDSFGNTIPGYLFGSFKEIHVLDFRYFTRNLRQYVKENGITDIALTFNIFNTCSAGNMDKVKSWITQPNGSFSTASSSAAPQKKEAAPAKPAQTPTPKKESPTPAQKEKAPAKTPEKTPEAPKADPPKPATPPPSSPTEEV